VAQAGKWTLASGDQSALVVGREDMLHLEDDCSVCVERVEEQAETGGAVKLTWKSPKPELLDVAVPLKDAAPGPVTLEVYQWGLDQPDKLALKAYAEAAALDRLTLSAGDQVATLRGKRLDEVAKADLEGMELKPGKLRRVEDFDQLAMNVEGSTASLDPAKTYVAKVQLEDGRQLKVPVTVEPPKPQVTLLNKGVQEAPSAAPSPVRFGSLDDLPVDGRLVFFLKSRVPANFPRNENVEVAAVDGSFHTDLSLADGSLMLEDAKTAMGTVDPLARFGPSAFGPVAVRATSADGVPGDWLPLGTLVRVPGFKELRCPRVLSKPCTLTGTNLFLISSIGTTPDDNDSTDVPPDFTGMQLSVPHPANGLLYIWLRDDPATAQTLAMAVTPESKSATTTAMQAPVTPVQPAAAPSSAPAQPENTNPENPAKPNVPPNQ